MKGRRSATLIAAVDPDNVEGHHPVRIQSKRGRVSARRLAEKPTPAIRLRPVTNVVCVTSRYAKSVALLNAIRDN